ncbi:hypothetical protein [Streptomyces sp. NRRL B-3648]|uniref:hypothetical protein n=1 Tax=Streptomyces sp. NRRL B-3648 TaxID=1519493 RepID=UPI0006AE5975|nr:hypothetical protein [Streptomyces sp. NRRL B-3648]KOV93139.1 hypothetical protein ADL04_28145 [Streptomyces sp. NRRL B-3648]
MSSSLLEPLLPPGKKIRARSTSAVGVSRCRLLVDGKIVFSSSVEKHDANTTANDVASSAFGVDPTDARGNRGHVIYSTTGAVGLVECPEPTSANGTVWATVRTSHDVDAPAVHKFIEGYATALAKSGVCRTSSAH